jgi:hypothetical protein
MVRLRWFGAVAAVFAGRAVAQESTLAVFTFDEAAPRDVTSNNVAAAITGTPTTFVPGYEGSAFRFDGGVQAIRVSLNINPAVLPRFTMGAWVRPTAGNAVRHVLSHDNGGYDRDLCIDTRGGGLGWSAFRGSGVLGFVPVVLDEWIFLAVVYDQGAGTVRLHAGEQVRSGSGTLGAGNTFVEIANSPCCDLNFAGDIDNVFFIEGALTAERINQIRIEGIRAVEECATVWQHPSPADICPGATARFSVVGAGAGNLRYQWRHNSVEIEGGTGPELVIAHAGADDIGEYDCIVTNDCRSVTSNPASLTLCPADFNCDAAANSQDFFDFLTSFFALAPSADFNGDGVINSQDFFDFLTAFFAGC